MSLQMWHAGRTIWLYGEGKKLWYVKEFQEIYCDASSGRKAGEIVFLKKKKTHLFMLLGGGKVGLAFKFVAHITLSVVHTATSPYLGSFVEGQTYIMQH